MDHQMNEHYDLLFRYSHEKPIDNKNNICKLTKEYPNSLQDKALPKCERVTLDLDEQNCSKFCIIIKVII